MRYTVLLAALLPILAWAQIDSLWSRTFGGAERDLCFVLQQTADSGYIMGGCSKSYANGLSSADDFWIVKTNINGDSLWSRHYGGRGIDHLRSILQTSDGGMLLVGDTRSYGAGFSDFWILKTNADGDSLWNRYWGGDHLDFCTAAQELADGSFILAGDTYSFGAGWVDVWLIKTDTNGDSIWSRTYGGSDNDECVFVKQTADGGYLLIGETASYGAGTNDFWMLKVDADGDSLWSRTYGGVYFDYCQSAIETADGGYLIVGYTHSFGAGFSDFYAVKTDSNGDSLWTRTYGTEVHDQCFTARQTDDGGYLLGGYTCVSDRDSADLWIVKTDADGDSLWSCIYGGIGFDVCNSICQISDTDYLLAGYTDSYGAGDDDFWLMKVGQKRELIPDTIHVPFETMVIADNLTGVTDLAVGDIDWDGDLDVAAVDMFADAVLAYDNLGNGAFLERLIDDSLNGAAAIDVGLLYSSTILDIVATGRFDNDIRVYKHFGEWAFMPYVLIGEDNNKNDVLIADDESFAIFSSSIEGNVIYWEADLLEDHHWMPHPISGSRCNVDHLRTASINDPQLDVIGASRASGDVYWWDGEAGGFIEYQVLSGVHLNAFDVADMDGDQDLDLLCATTSGDILWFENRGYASLVEHAITGGMQYPFDIAAADIDLDGVMDFVIADTYADEISWWHNAGDGHFRRKIIADDFTQARVIEVVDFDGDGDIDIVGAGQNGIMLWQNYLIIPDETANSRARLTKPNGENERILPEHPQTVNDTPTEFALHKNYPNPFNASTTISFDLPVQTEVTLTVHDMLGRKTATLLDGAINAGFHTLHWTCPDCATGVYFVIMQTPEFRAVQKALLIK